MSTLSRVKSSTTVRHLMRRALGQRIEHEVHAPGVVRHGGRQQFLPLTHRTLGLAPFAHLQLGFLVQAINLFVIHGWKLRAQQIMQSAIAEAAGWVWASSTSPRRQRLRGWRRHGCVAESIAGQPRKAASPALASTGCVRAFVGLLALALRASVLPRSQPSALRCPGAPRQQLLQSSVLDLQFFQPLGLVGLHPPVLAPATDKSLRAENHADGTTLPRPCPRRPV